MYQSTGVRAELVLGAAQRGASATAGPGNNAFLQQRLSYDGEKLLDEQQRGVMMAWEGAHVQSCAVVFTLPQTQPEQNSARCSPI